MYPRLFRHDAHALAGPIPTPGQLGIVVPEDEDDDDKEDGARGERLTAAQLAEFFGVAPALEAPVSDADLEEIFGDPFLPKIR